MKNRVIPFIAKIPKREAYLFQITNKKGKVVREYFSSKAYGHVNVALRAAIKYRDNFIRKEFGCTTEEWRTYKQRTKGVSRLKRGKRRDGSEIIIFVATWTEGDRKRTKNFMVTKDRNYAQTKKEALDYRKKMVEEERQNRLKAETD